MGIRMKPVRVFRASPGTLNGRIDFVGVRNLEVYDVELGNRINTPSGNGVPSPTIERSSKTVEVVLIDGKEYVLSPYRLSGNDALALREVTVAHEAAVGRYCEHCGNEVT